MLVVLVSFCYQAATDYELSYSHLEPGLLNLGTCWPIGVVLIVHMYFRPGGSFITCCIYRLTFILKIHLCVQVISIFVWWNITFVFLIYSFCCFCKDKNKPKFNYAQHKDYLGFHFVLRHGWVWFFGLDKHGKCHISHNSWLGKIFPALKFVLMIKVVFWYFFSGKKYKLI